jgi:hypothetical protein
MTVRPHRTAAAVSCCIAVLSLSLLAACGGSLSGGATASDGSSPSAPTGHLRITATRSPTCPVEHVGGPPCVAPYTGPLEVIRPDGSVLAVTTSTSGTVDLDLAPGTYRITLANPNGGIDGLHQPVSVMVVAGATANAAVDIDTGIR